MKTQFVMALDRVTPETAYRLAKQFRSRCHSMKVNSLFYQYGPEIIRELRKLKVSVWADMKCHDIPSTVTEEVRALISHGTNIITVHASGGQRMLEAAVETTRKQAEIWAVTLLTSLSKEDLRCVHDDERSTGAIACDLALMAKRCGIGTIVCSAIEVGYLSKEPALRGMRFAVPGTRLDGNTGDHERWATPAEAVLDGADILVLGREVTTARDPEAMFEAITESLP